MLLATTSMTRQASSCEVGRGVTLFRQPRNVLLAIGCRGVQSCRYHIHCFVSTLYIPDVQNVCFPVRSPAHYRVIPSQNVLVASPLCGSFCGLCNWWDVQGEFEERASVSASHNFFLFFFCLEKWCVLACFIVHCRTYPCDSNPKDVPDSTYVCFELQNSVWLDNAVEMCAR